jgi:hypothetical protein
MSNVIVLADSTNTVKVDFTDSASVSRKGDNTGLINISIPADYSWDGKGGAFLINLKMVSDRITIKFTFRDGVGTHYVPLTSTESLSTMAAKTKYEKLWYIFKHNELDKLFFFGDDTNSTSNQSRFIVQIQDVDVTIEGGYKDIVTGSVSLIIGNSTT